MTTDKCSCGRFGKWTVIAVVLVLALGVLSWATMEQRKSIAKTLGEMKECSTFASCVEKAGLNGVLEKDGPFTVFVPTNEAFEQVPEKDLQKLLDNKSALTAVLLYHMVPKTLSPAEMTNVGDCMTCTVPQSAITCSANTFGKGKCVKSEIPCSNGFIYIIDSVQFPPFLTNPEVFQAEEVTVVETVGEAAPAADSAPETKSAETAKPIEKEKPAEAVKQAEKEKPAETPAVPTPEAAPAAENAAPAEEPAEPKPAEPAAAPLS